MTGGVRGYGSSMSPDETPRGARSAESTGQGSASGGPDGLGELMGRVARSLQEEHGDVEATLHTIAVSAVDAVPGAEACTITYVTGRRSVEPRASTGDLPRRIDLAQGRLHEGPCLDSVWQEQTVRVEDMRTEDRWPRFAAEAVGLGVLSSLSFQLFVEGDNLGAMNLYARSPHAFGEESEDVGLALAAHAAVALAGAQREDNLRRAVDNRDLIGQAKGILMERYKITGEQAFQVLARASQQANRKVVDVAEELTRTGAVPEGG